VNCRTYSDLNNSRAPSGSVIGGNTPWENTLNSQTARRDYQATVIQNRALLAGTGSNANTGSVASTKSNDAAPTDAKYGKAVGEQMLSSVFKDANVANPNTLVGAMSTACFGGVVFSLQKKQAIDCSYLQCLKEQSSTGSSVAVCDLSRGYAVCMNVMGEAGEFPLVRTFKNIAANVNAIIQNWPSYVAKSLLDVRCLPAQVSPPPFPCTDWYRIGCRVQESFFSVSDAARQTTQAFGGIRDDEGKRYREMCTAAINYKPGTRTQASQALSSGQQALGQFAPNYAQALNALPKLMAMGRDIDARKAANAPLSTPMGVISNAWSQEYASDMASGNKGVKTVPAITGITRVTDIRASGGKPALQIVTIQTTDGERRIEVPAGTIPSDKVALFTDGNFIALQKAGYGDAALYMTTEQLNRYGSAFVKAGQATDLLAGSADAKTAMQRYFACSDDTCKKEALAKVPKEYTITQTSSGLSITAPVRKTLYQTCQLSECVCGPGGCNVQFRTVDEITHDLSLTSEQVTALEKYKDAYQQGSEDISGLTAAGLSIDPKTNVVYKTETIHVTTELTKEQYTLTLSRNNARVAQARAELVGKFSDYAAQWMYQKGYLNFMTLSGMGINFRTLDPEEWKRSACSDIADINDNEEGTIIDFGDSPVLAKPVASFGSEIRALDNGSTRQYAYITAVHVYNAERNHTPFDRRSFNYTMEVVLTGLKSCAGSCPNELSLTNGGVFKLDEGVTFGNGNAPKTRIDYLPGEYQKICLRFDHKFPDPVTGNTIYCRTIKETVFNTGSPQPPPTSEVDRFGYTVNSAGTGSAGANGPAPIDPLRGWS
jgi:hypothetical protein